MPRLALIPEERDELALRRGLALRAGRHLGRLVVAGGPLPASVRRIARSILDAALPEARERFLAAGETRTWIRAVRDAVALERASRREDLSGLVERVADLGLLAGLAPRGRIPAGFRLRVRAEARSLLRRLAAEFPAVALAAIPPAGRRGRLALTFREDPEWGRPPDEIWIAGTGWTVVGSRRRGVRVSVALRRDGVTLGAMRLPYPEAGDTGRPRIGATIVSGVDRIAVDRRDPAFEGRVGLALDLLEAAWPAGAGIVTRRIAVVVPVRERGLVSFSSASLPGVVYVNVTSRPAVRLAEDLLHEATHARIHEIEEAGPLVAEARTRGEGDEARYWSPWRREWRPLRGMLHGACTFTVGARYFERLLAASAPGGAVRLARSRRRWIARRFLEEMESVSVAGRALRRAAGGGDLTARGQALARAVADEHAALRPRLAAARRILSDGVAGRRDREALRRFAAELRAKPLRWGKW